MKNFSAGLTIQFLFLIYFLAFQPDFFYWFQVVFGLRIALCCTLLLGVLCQYAFTSNTHIVFVLTNMVTILQLNFFFNSGSELIHTGHHNVRASLYNNRWYNTGWDFNEKDSNGNEGCHSNGNGDCHRNGNEGCHGNTIERCHENSVLSNENESCHGNSLNSNKYNVKCNRDDEIQSRHAMKTQHCSGISSQCINHNSSISADCVESCADNGVQSYPQYRKLCCRDKRAIYQQKGIEYTQSHFKNCNHCDKKAVLQMLSIMLSVSNAKSGEYVMFANWHRIGYVNFVSTLKSTYSVFLILFRLSGIQKVF